jgi:hypothetical protein
MVTGGFRTYEIYRPYYWNTAEILNPFEPVFSITATPATQTINYGSSAKYTVTVTQRTALQAA